VSDSIATTLHYLYEGFDPAEVGEDYALGSHAGDIALSAQKVAYFREVNEARRAAGVLSWDGLMQEAYYVTRTEDDPNLLTDRLLELAATTIAYAESVQRQTDEFNVAEVEAEVEASA